jgi:3-hexulose-6-phosphate synthase
MEIMMACKLQIALDFAELQPALEMARKVSPWVDIMEAGTPLIKSVGLEVVRQLRAEFPDKLIYADMKSTDVGAFEADLAFKAGADFTVASGVTTLATIEEVQRVALEWERTCVVDLTGIRDIKARCNELEPLDVKYVLVHRSIDEEVTSGATWSERDCAMLEEIHSMGMQVMIAGGLNVDNIELFCDIPLYAIVVGRGITSQADPAAAAEKLAGVIQSQFPDSGAA